MKGAVLGMGLLMTVLLEGTTADLNQPIGLIDFVQIGMQGGMLLGGIWFTLKVILPAVRNADAPSGALLAELTKAVERANEIATEREKERIERRTTDLHMVEGIESRLTKQHEELGKFLWALLENRK